jgi:WD40 repeat protein
MLYYAMLCYAVLQGDGWISRQAAGLCFDFHPADPTVYVTGTEEGNLHRCSVSYSEQYLETYEPHHGPVYKVKFSPHWSDVFLTCSADWSMNLYHLRKRTAVINMHGTGEDYSVNDVCWCPGNSTVRNFIL